MAQDIHTRGERRDNKRRKRRQMGMSGSGVRRLQELILRKNRSAYRQRKNWE